MAKMGTCFVWILFFHSSFSFASEEGNQGTKEFKTSPVKVSEYWQAIEGAPFSVLPNSELNKRNAKNLGDLLSEETGIHSSQFGPQASRPVIRGLDGDRVRILENGLGTMDASNVSPDHAVSFDPMILESVEMVRGPSALLFSSSAIGGIVQTQNLRIARSPLPRKEAFVKTEVQSVDRSSAFGAWFRHPFGQDTVQWILELDASIRKHGEQNIPGFARSKELREESPVTDEVTKQLKNSELYSNMLGIGLSRVQNDGYVGSSFQFYDSTYGTVADPNVTIIQKRYRLELDAESKKILDSARLRLAGNFYHHSEMEGDEVGTSFRNRGVEGRVDFKHSTGTGSELWNRGSFGLQVQGLLSEAAGDEAFLPSHFQNQVSAFGYEEFPNSVLIPTFGLRLGQSRLRSEPSLAFPQASSRIDFESSVSLGLRKDWNSNFVSTLTGTLSNRAPSPAEVLANGPHAATGQYEVGNLNQVNERAMGLELTNSWKSDLDEIQLSVFHQRFSRFLSLSPTGGSVTLDDGDVLDEWLFAATEANFYGYESQVKKQMPFKIQNSRPWVAWNSDFTRGVDVGRSANLPRMPALRNILKLGLEGPEWDGQVEFQRNESQTFVAANEKYTDAFHLLNLRLGYKFLFGNGLVRAGFRVNNILDAEARNAVSPLKDISPLAGRNFGFSLQANL